MKIKIVFKDSFDDSELKIGIGNESKKNYSDRYRRFKYMVLACRLRGIHPRMHPVCRTT